MRGRSGRELVLPGASRLHAPLFVACGCLYSGTGIANSPCSWCAVLVEVSGPRPHRRRRQTACRRGNWKFARRARLAKRDSSVQRNTARETTAHHVLSGQRFDARPSKILATRLLVWDGPRRVWVIPGGDTRGGWNVTLVPADV
jgi:hypothetical protein